MIDGLLDHVATWSGLGFLLLVFGLLPGLVLRIIVWAAYRPGDPKRQELLGELYAMSRWARPFWVCEQFETALFEGRLAELVSSALHRPGGKRKIDESGDRRQRLIDVAFMTVALLSAMISGVMFVAEEIRISGHSVWEIIVAISITGLTPIAVVVVTRFVNRAVRSRDQAL